MEIAKIKVIFFKSCFYCFDKLREIGVKVKMSNMEKEYIIAKALETDEGREALVKAMVEPVTCKMPKYVYEDTYSVEHEFKCYKIKVSNILLKHFCDNDENLNNKMTELTRHSKRWSLCDKILDYVGNKGMDTSSQEILDYIEELDEEEKHVS